MDDVGLDAVRPIAAVNPSVREMVFRPLSSANNQISLFWGRGASRRGDVASYLPLQYSAISLAMALCVYHPKCNATLLNEVRYTDSQ